MLTERQIMILKVIVDEFIDTAQPVGSRNIAKNSQIDFSPATIRNEMADLEELGFLQKTHSSSGRSPSEKGYRFYVDHLLAPMSLSQEEIKTIRHYFSHRMFELERVMENSAYILSEMTQYTTLVLGPEIFETKLKHVQIVPISQHSAVAILVTDTGHVEHRSFILPNDLKREDIEKTVNILNEKLAGVPLVYLDQFIEKEIKQLIRKYTKDFSKVYDVLQKALLTDLPSTIYVSGKANILMQPEFDNIEKARDLFEMMEREDEMAPILRPKKDGTHIYIGHENNNEILNDCTLITTTYSIGSDQKGSLAILGPTRMDYSRAVTLLNFWSQNLSRSLSHWLDEQ